MELRKEDHDVYECPSCGSLGVRSGETCCGDRREVVDIPAVFHAPDTETVFKEIFGMSETELSLCYTLMAEEESTVKSLASRLDHDMSTINRHLNHLVELGVVERESRGLAKGGRAHVYSPVPIDDVQRQFRISLYGWLTVAIERVEEMNQEKLEAMVQTQASSEEEAEAIAKSETEQTATEKSEPVTDGSWHSLITQLFK